MVGIFIFVGVNTIMLADSHIISYLIFSKVRKDVSQNLSSAAVLIGTLRVNMFVL